MISDFTASANKLIYFAYNYNMTKPITYKKLRDGEVTENLPEFLTAEWNCPINHIIRLWKESRDNGGVDGWLPMFYGKLDSYNRKVFLDWIDKNYELGGNYGLPQTTYRHLGYYNNLSDIINLADRTADDILTYQGFNFGHFYKDENPDAETDIILEEENLNNPEMMLTEDKEYLVINQAKSFANIDSTHRTGNDDESDIFIDIYVKI